MDFATVTKTRNGCCRRCAGVELKYYLVGKYRVCWTCFEAYHLGVWGYTSLQHALKNRKGEDVNQSG